MARLGSPCQTTLQLQRGHGMSDMETALADDEDRISALPDDLLLHLMSFLLSRDAVRTCVLAKRWRTLWKSVPALRIDDPESDDGATGFSAFVDELLRHRDPTPLNLCIIKSDVQDMVDEDSDWNEEVFERVEPWLQYAVSCHVEDLRVYFPLQVTNMTLISKHLKRLNFFRMWFEGCSLDFSSCQVLEVLENCLCRIFADISSPSLKYLDICSDFDSDRRADIFAPNLVGFRLIVNGGLTPFIHSMPSLVTASVTLRDDCADQCTCGNLSCEGCPGEAGDINISIVLQGLFGDMSLQLDTDDPAVFIFRKDLKWCPKFSKLKTVSLNYWCLVDGFKGLVYFLQLPILETLTIDLKYLSLLREEPHKQKLLFETDESYNPREQLLLSKHFKVVTILCQTREDAKVPHILMILSALGVPSKQIVIQTTDEED